MTSGTDPHAIFMRKDAGLSLLELLITLALMALVMGLAVPSLFGTRPEESINTVHTKLTDALQKVQRDAVMKHMTISLLIQPSSLEQQGQAIFQLPEDMQFATQRHGETLNFFADGTSSSAILMIVNDHKAMTGLRINGLTGRISPERGAFHDR